jgi:hypothetical protein
LESKKYEVTDTGLKFSRKKLTVQEYKELLRIVGSTVTVGPWLVGDAVNYGESRYGEKYAEYIDSTGLSPERLRVCSWVANRYPRNRRFANASFEVHRELAYIRDDYEQDALLNKAIAEGWTSKDVREYKRNERGAANTFTPLWRITLELDEEWNENFDGDEFIEYCNEFFADWDVKVKHSRPDGY